MRRINKRKSSPELVDFCKKETKPVYEGGLDSLEGYKEHFFKLREQLVEEQFAICCYCQQRIEIVKNATPKMKTEHFLPKNIYNGNNGYEDLSLEYGNLLAACLGNTNNVTHCDSSKGGKVLQNVPNPATNDFDLFKMKYIAYTKPSNFINRRESDRFVNVRALNHEVIESETDEQRKRQFQANDPLVGTNEGCLNLNHQSLASSRAYTWHGVLRIFASKIKGDWKSEAGKKLARQLVEKFRTPKDGKLEEFSQVIVDLLVKEFKI